MSMPDDYIARDATGWETVLFRGRRTLQSAELNETQIIGASRLKRLGDALFKDGDVQSGADVIIDPDSGRTTITGGAIYVRGDIRGVPPAAFTVPVLGGVTIGVRLTERVITELEDPSLLNPMPGSETFHSPGAARLTLDTAWGWRAADGTTDGGAGDFYGVFAITNGVLNSKTPPPNLDGVSQALQRYARAMTGGTHVVSGLVLHALEIRDGNQIFSLGDGKALVDGAEVEKPTATRLAYPVDPDLRLIETEARPFASVNGKMRINTTYGPIAELVEVKCTAQRTEIDIVHGSYTGVTDALPDVSILKIIAVKQGSTTYTVGADVKLTGNGVDWSPNGAEPAPGSTYKITYQYMTDAKVSAQDDTGFTVEGAVEGTLILTDYRIKLPRYDRIVMDRTGRMTRVRGVADLLAPAVPSIPTGTLNVGTAYQTWFGLPTLTLDCLKTVTVSEQQALIRRVDAVFDLVAQERLKTDATAREPTGAKGVFVDPLFDNDMRDQGVAQNAAVAAGELILPIVPVFPDALAKDGGAAMLTYTLEAVVEQIAETGSVKINPYDSFTPIPATVTVITPVDRWTVTQERWDDESIRFVRTGHFVPGVSRVMATKTLGETIETVADTTTAAQYLREIPLIVRVEHLGPGERVPEITFDGVVVGRDLTADANGVVEHHFVIPAGIPSGTKKVAVGAASAGLSVATFVGEGQVETIVRKRVSTVEEYHVDPQGESFRLTEGRHIGGVDLKFTAVGSSQVVVQLRSASNGWPGRDILAEARLDPSRIRVDGQPTRFEWSPVWLAADEEVFFVVLCDDADAGLAVATLGQFDAARQQWLTRQPYQVGVRVSSSNGSTWTAHQDSDLWFRVLGCRFTATSRTVPLGKLTAAQVSDLIGLFNAERPDVATNITLRVIAADGRVFSLSDGQPINLTDRLTGDVSLQLVLEGTDTRSPVVYPGIQAIFGVQTDTATYVSRQIATPSAAKIRVILDVVTPGTSSVTPEVLAADGVTWLAVPLKSGTAIGDGWEERVFVLDPFAAAATRLRLTLKGSALNRPRVRRIRAIAS